MISVINIIELSNILPEKSFLVVNVYHVTINYSPFIYMSIFIPFKFILTVRLLNSEELH